MTKTRDLKRWLRDHGCELLREGGDHSIWRNPSTRARAPVSRHREIPTHTASGICDQLGVPRMG